LRHVQDVLKIYRGYFDALPDEASRLNRLCEVNVMVQVQNLAETTIVQDAWQRGQDLSVHGWIYGLDDGILKNLGVSHRMDADLSDDMHQRVKTLFAKA
jgi:carbonic anhydrase